MKFDCKDLKVISSEVQGQMSQEIEEEWWTFRQSKKKTKKEESSKFNWHHLHPNPSSMVFNSSFYINNSTDVQVWLTYSRFFCYTTGSLLVISVGRANLEVADRLGDSESTMGLRERLDKGPANRAHPLLFAQPSLG
ncbi:hypothetical protein PGT21_016432 [Puccinia graminis f. sp. tritici]|uniref:Uncharacterized protein n=1 Tax=Puccinia graminis f. sp. tritici TaxID=56615 RepID=A0A5B0QTA4_PUCGR|nr:hypothetical protein PGT21_016432 [Puccinia graminis f. sp. tritici]